MSALRDLIRTIQTMQRMGAFDEDDPILRHTEAVVAEQFEKDERLSFAVYVEGGCISEDDAEIATLDEACEVALLRRRQDPAAQVVTIGLHYAAD